MNLLLQLFHDAAAAAKLLSRVASATKSYLRKQTHECVVPEMGKIGGVLWNHGACQ
jgi:hypothetical protein